MVQFQLFDGVKLIEDIPLTDGGAANEGTIGTIVEVLGEGKAYIVELFGGWVKYDENGKFMSATQDEAESFMETIGVETVYPHQLVLTIPARETMGVREHLTAVLDNLSDDLVAEVRDFAEFLQQKQQQKQVSPLLAVLQHQL
ncbi:DUF2281 domain-containing protein [Planktothrix mougeotii]|uniref:DUF2281 domain-containing protein n=1 Tax=Planktothrix mougeotii LEGE 06226 TaxID=1828728 RepID=A0ABR9UBJ6_9CYAN|nr:DUF2281 domain-containing protein [Planktothrix mougeotii]MBE9143835.1 DUF2281 domain-containing protein [Planktothrix mougeotii LEGE 06226]